MFHWLLILLSIACAEKGAERAPLPVESKVEIVARRLIDREHWQPGPEAPYRYGPPALYAWIKATEHVESKWAERAPTIEDLKEVHRLAYDFEGATFKAYFIQQLNKLPNDRKRTRGYLLVDKNDQESLARDYGLKPPFGQLRDGTVGSTRRLQESESYSAEQLANLKKNSYLTIQKETLQPDGTYRVIFRWPKGEEVAELTKQAFDRMQKSVAALDKNDKDYEAKAIAVAARFYRELVSIHPVWDGSGRTSKLMRDWLLGFLGLPPPDSTPANDLELSEEEIARDLAESIARTRAKLGKFRAGLTSNEYSKMRYRALPWKQRVTQTLYRVCRWAGLVP